MSIEPNSRLTHRHITITAVALCIASLALFWPGTAMYDTVTQYQQVLSGVYDDWHPPAMARVWALLAPLGPGATPMLVLQLVTYWLGLGLIATALARIGRTRGAAAILAIGLLPPFLGWQGVVLKDAQLAGALLAAIGIIGWWRLARRPLPRAMYIPVALLLAYAVLVRANAVFIVVPLIVTLAPRPAHPLAKLVAGLVAVVAVLGVAPIVNHQLLRAQPSGVEATQALYDIAGIAARTPDGKTIGLTRQETATVIQRRCAKPFFWDPLGDDAHCGTTMARLRALPTATLYVTLASAALHHPIAYAGHRFAHLNSTDRWLVPFHWPSAAPPVASEPNTIGLANPSAGASAWEVLTAMIVETPFGWPIAWIVVAITALAASLSRPRDPVRELATALLVSALALEVSFAALSIASDLRYHLWSMIATAVSVVLLADRAPPLRVVMIGATALTIVICSGLAARMTLPLPPQSYAGMLG
ncbi:hypothetical protein C8J44_1776 [Sphingomonas sp. PP-CE-3A-406]|uniref:hypothetical protein n=1 Tax=Sphingomonas sp. PP-CE-3A-406 TaxID=2135659 RepID=UPI000EF9A487|nr:hypothetical protein [Sphingomonas sp. PP-CE-3A-406]RMB54160.1 hypothetical protein C8J44_1776 [Sphingomonas sp. PP-CE-3A-406]